MRCKMSGMSQSWRTCCVLILLLLSFARSLTSNATDANTTNPAPNDTPIPDTAPVPSPAIPEVSPSPVETVPAPSPVDIVPVPSPAIPEVSPSPVETVPAPSPIDVVPVPSPAIPEVSPSPVDTVPVPSPEESPSPSPFPDIPSMISPVPLPDSPIPLPDIPSALSPVPIPNIPPLPSNITNATQICNPNPSKNMFTWCDTTNATFPRVPFIFNFSVPKDFYFKCDGDGTNSSNGTSTNDACYMTIASGLVELPTLVPGQYDRFFAVTGFNSTVLFSAISNTPYQPMPKLDMEDSLHPSQNTTIFTYGASFLKKLTLSLWINNDFRYISVSVENDPVLGSDTILPNSLKVFSPKATLFEYLGFSLAFYNPDTHTVTITVNGLRVNPNPNIKQLDFSPKWKQILFSDGPTDPEKLRFSVALVKPEETFWSFVLAVAGTNYVHIFRPSSLLPEVYRFSWQNTSTFSMFYKAASHEEIISMDIFFDHTIRTPQGFSPNQEVLWLSLLIRTSPTTSELKIIGLPEFSKVEGQMPIDNPVGRAYICPDFNQYVDPITHLCTDRPTYIFPIHTEKPVALTTRYMNPVSFSTGNSTMDPYISILERQSGYNNTKQYTAIFVAHDREISVYGLIPEPDTLSDSHVEFMSSHILIGRVRHFSVSSNGQHLFAYVERNRWELDGMIRWQTICDTALYANLSKIDQQFYEPYRSRCEQNYYRGPNLNDFFQYIGVCPYNTHCPTFSRPDAYFIEDGYFSSNSFLKEKCTPGSYCRAGLKLKCPLGTICPGEGNAQPKLCATEMVRDDFTCYAEGLEEPIECPMGTVCILPYIPPFPTPPGYFSPITGIRADFEACKMGDYCSIGRHANESRLCPANTYCSSPSVIVPTVCSCNASNNTCSYCPEGTWWDQPCPAGYYCPGPDKLKNCSDTQYCPTGSLSPLPCPAGYFCPTPATSILCPKGYFCPTGSITPNYCSVMSVCEPGSVNQGINFTILIVVIILAIIVIVAWKGYYYYVDKRREMKKQGKNDDYEEMNAGVSFLSFASKFFEDKPRLTSNAINLKRKDFTVDIEFKNLSLTLHGKSGKKVLSGVDGALRAGRVTAIMGPSGAGKTTFLTTIAGKAYYGKTGGEILLNGEPASIGTIRKLMGFVPQEDVMLRMLKVKEIFNFNSEMRLPPDMPHEERRALVNSVINLLGLSEIQYEAIGDESQRGISGGQRKRVNIGMELVANPTILLLDEPTSGLDSTGSLEVCKILRSVARLGLTVATVIHQPRYDIFTMFDDVLLLGKGGKTVYLGPTKNALPYFTHLGFKIPKHANPADFFMDVISGQVPCSVSPTFKPEDLFELWEKNKSQYGSAAAKLTRLESSTDSDDDRVQTILEDAPPVDPNVSIFELQAPVAPPDEFVAVPPTPGAIKEPPKAGVFKQLLLFTTRAVRQQGRAIPAIVVDFAISIITALFFGTVFMKMEYHGPPPSEACDSILNEGLRKRCMLPIDDPFFTIASLVNMLIALHGATSSLRIFGPERVVFWRESSAGGNTLAYFLGKDFAYVPNNLIFPALYFGIFYTFTSPRGSFLFSYMVLCLAWYNAAAISYIVSVVVPPALAQVTAVISVFACMMFAGSRPTIPEMKELFPPLSYVHYLSFLRYANEAYYVTEIKEWQSIYNVQSGMEIYGYNLDSVPLNIGILFVLGTGLRIIAILLMHFYEKEKRN